MKLTEKQIEAAKAAGIRLETLTSGVDWVRPTPEEINAMLNLIPRKYTQAALGRMMGVKAQFPGHNITRWIKGRAKIGYADWCILAELAGFGLLWHLEPTQNKQA